MQEHKKPVEQREPSPRPQSGVEVRATDDTPPPSEPFFESGLRQEKPPRSGEEHGGAADAGQERWAQPGVKEGPPPELAKPTGTATGSPSETPKAPPGPDADEGDGLSGWRKGPRGRGPGAGAGPRRAARQAPLAPARARLRAEGGPAAGASGRGGEGRARARAWTPFYGGDTCAARTVDVRPGRPYTLPAVVASMSAPALPSPMPLPLLLSAGAGGGVEVDINPGLVALQLVLLALTWLVLKPLLFEPLLSLYEEREKRVEGARAEARRMDDQAAEMLRKYEKEIEQVHRVAADERERLRAEAQALETRSLDEARAEVGAVLEQGRRAIAEEVRAVEAALAQDVEPLARSVAAQVLGREVRG